MQESQSDPPLSRRLTLVDVPPEGLAVDIETTPREREGLAALNEIPAVLSAQAKLTARHWRRDGLEIEGVVTARVRQICVVTLDEFDSDVSESVSIRFAPLREAGPPRDKPTSRRRAAAPPPPQPEDEMDAPDPLIGGAIDLGAIVSEFLTLALDPYPRKPGAQFAEAAAEAPGASVSPFAALHGRKPGSSQR